MHETRGTGISDPPSDSLPGLDCRTAGAATAAPDATVRCGFAKLSVAAALAVSGPCTDAGSGSEACVPNMLDAMGCWAVDTSWDWCDSKVAGGSWGAGLLPRWVAEPGTGESAASASVGDAAPGNLRSAAVMAAQCVAAA